MLNLAQCTNFNGMGTCWVLPASCNDTAGAGYACGTLGTCKSACELIAGQEPWYPSSCSP